MNAIELTRVSKIYRRYSGRQFATLQQRNVKIVRPPHIIAALPNQDLWLLWLRDSEGNLLGIMEERKK